jgi:hydrogenase/urease accessory protein HupE
MTRGAWLLVLVAPACALAHSFEPALLDLRERRPGLFDVAWKTPGPLAGGLSPELPAHCRRRDLSSEGEGITFFQADCGTTGLRGERVAVRGLAGTRVDAIVRIEWTDGTVTSGVLGGTAEELVVPTMTGTGGVGTGAPARVVLWSYGRLGVAHILFGFDHLLFVLALLLLVPGVRALVRTITAFTVAHSLTLALAVLGVVHVPAAPVEALIAASIVLLAAELTRPADAPPTLARRWPWAVAFLFGLLHGLGFAGALAEVGLPADQIPLALLAFNLGVETGQLVFVAAMLGPVIGVRRLTTARAWVRLVPAYAIGVLATAWTLERF